MKYSTDDLKDLLDFADTDAQKRYLKKVIETGSNRKAAAALGVVPNSVNLAIQRVVALAAKRGWAPKYDMTHLVPDGFSVKGVSTYYDKDGKVRGQWVKSKEDEARREEMLREMVQAVSSDIPRALPVNRPAKKLLAELINCYIVTDFHLGMMAWHEETGADWDTKIAEDLLVGWFATAIEGAPNAETAIFAQLGDFLHWDGLDAVTPTHHNVLDADTRFQKVVRVAIRAVRRIIDMLLRKHGQVHVIMAEGNHDPASSVWLRELLAALYEREPRVTVDQNADVYYCYEHGNTSLFFHHGHKRSPEDIDDVFVAKYREVFGRTQFSYAHMGHKHCINVKETKLMVVEQHRTLAAPDAYASRGGWVSGRDAKVITYHKDYGEVGRITISPDMTRGAK